MAARITFNPETFIRTEVCFIIKKASVLLVLFLSIICTSKAQVQEHAHEDSLVVLNRDAFSVSILHSTDSMFWLEILNNSIDSITPFFVEFSINGFLFTQNCILEQSINNLRVENNIERIYGPQFVALGVGNIPPLGNYKTKLGTFNRNTAANASIQVRIFGMINGHNVIWNGNLKG